MIIILGILLVTLVLPCISQPIPPPSVQGYPVYLIANASNPAIYKKLIFDSVGNRVRFDIVDGPKRATWIGSSGFVYFYIFSDGAPPSCTVQMYSGDNFILSLDAKLGLTYVAELQSPVVVAYNATVTVVGLVKYQGEAYFDPWTSDILGIRLPHVNPPTSQVFIISLVGTANDEVFTTPSVLPLCNITSHVKGKTRMF